VLELTMPEHFRGFAAVAERDGGTTYATICRGVADDAEVLSLLDAAPPAQQRPLLLLAAVHFLLLSGIAHPLAAHYDTVTAMVGPPPDSPTNDVTADFVSFCHDFRPELTQLIATRRTQTNEVGRCTALLPGLCHVASLHPDRRPLSLLDLGASAGLNLLFDDYAYTYREPEGDAVLTAGVPGAPVSLRCTARSGLGLLPDLRLPPMAERVGLDLSPVNPRADDEARWLLACQWPDNPVRFANVRAAIDNVRATADPPRLEQGDMVHDLARVAGTIDGDGPLVVFHSWVAAYLGEEQQRALVEAVGSLSHDRPVHYLYAESAFETRGLPTPPPPEPRQGPDMATALVHVAPGAEPRRIADMHPHGYWLRWWPTRRDPTGRPAAPAPAPPPR
jgi:hypothetical protein